jgi:hypothetical protein
LVIVAAAVVEMWEIACHQMILEMHEMAAVAVVVEERRHKGTRSIASSRVAIECLA